MSQQPAATIAGKMRLCGPATLGEKNDRLRFAAFELRAVALITGTALTVFSLEDRACVAADRDCPELVPACVFLRLYVFGIRRTHFSGDC